MALAVDAPGIHAAGVGVEAVTTRRVALVVTLGTAWAVASACGGDVRHDASPDLGGAAGTGGVVGTGGAAGTGGVVGTGGAVGTGGTIVTSCSLPLDYFEVLQDGLWLCGWSGGLEHYSWVFFGPGSALSILDATCSACTSYFNCAGSDGHYFFGEAPGAVLVRLPSSCAAPLDMSWTLTQVCPPDGFPPGASAYATFTGPQGEIRCDRYPPGQCNTALPSCPTPW